MNNSLIKRFFYSIGLNIILILVFTLVILGMILKFSAAISILLSILGACLVGYTIWFFMKKPTTASADMRLFKYTVICFLVLVICLLLPQVPFWILWIFLLIIIAAIASLWLNRSRK